MAGSGYASLADLDAPRSYATLTGSDPRTALLAAPAFAHGQRFATWGYRSPGDQGHGLYYYNADSAAAANGGTVLEVPGQPGRLLLVHQGEVNVTQFGAWGDGSNRDCAPSVYNAMSDAAVRAIYYPDGIYTQTAVVPRSNLLFHGNGSSSVLRQSNDPTIPGNIQQEKRVIFAVSTRVYADGLGADGPVSNVEIRDLCMDFYNWDGSNPGQRKWKDFIPCITRRGGNAAYMVKGYRLKNLQFIDSAECPHPEILGQSGEDQWCIIMEGYDGGTEDFYLQDCVSLAESHQFYGGGGTGVRNATICNNITYQSHANAFTVVTVYGQELGTVEFRNIEFYGNKILGCRGTCFLIGRDPSFSATQQAIPNLQIHGISIHHNFYEARAPGAYGYTASPGSYGGNFCRIAAGEQGCSAISIRDNEMIYRDGWQPSAPSFFSFLSNNYNRANTTTSAGFTQPALGESVAVAMTAVQQDGRNSFVPGSIIGIQGAGYYQVQSIAGSNVTLQLLDWARYATARVDEVQNVRIDQATGGTFTLTFGGNTTSAIAWNANAAAVQAALEALASIGAGNVSVSAPGTGNNNVTFIGTLKGTDVALLVGDGSQLSGSGATLTISETTKGVAGATIASGKTVKFQGGDHRDIVVSGNRIPTDVDLISTLRGFVRNFSYRDNHFRSRLLIDKANIQNLAIQRNEGLFMEVTRSNALVKIAENGLLPIASSNGGIHLEMEPDDATGLAMRLRGVGSGNVLLDPRVSAPISTYGVKVDGSQAAQCEVRWGPTNYLRDTRARGFYTGYPEIQGMGGFYLQGAGQGYPPYIGRFQRFQFVIDWDFGTGDKQFVNLSCPGVKDADIVTFQPPPNAVSGFVRYYAYAKSTDVIQIQAVREAGSTFDPPSGTFVFETKATREEGA